MVVDRFPRALIEQVLLSPGAWRPFPTATDRAGWERLAPITRTELVAAGERALGEEWPAIPAHLSLEVVRTGNRAVYEARHFPRRSILAELVLAECAEGSGRFVDGIVDAVWSICEESSWCISAHTHMQHAGGGLPDTTEPVVDLFAAETAALLAWTLHLTGELLDRVSPLITARLRREMTLRVLDPCLTRDDFWWMGNTPRRQLNNWTPWICSNWLATIALVESDRERQVAAVEKAMGCLERFLEQQPADGGCDEGPGYWGRAGASTFDCLELLHGMTGGAIDLFREPLVRNLGAYIYRVHIDRDWYVNFADGGARQNIAAGLVRRFGRLAGDPDLERLGAYAEELGRDDALKWRASLPRALGDLFDPNPYTGPAGAPYVRDAWMPNLEVMTARCRAGTCEGFFVAAKGGHNAESHNHNDVGNVIVFLDGHPVLVDPGVETYTIKTFSGRRYEIWTMQSAYHNLPTFGGVQQIPGRHAAAADVNCRQDDAAAVFTLDAAGAYPEQAGVASFRRTVTLQRGRGVTIADVYALRREVPVELSLMTPCAVQTIAPGTILLVPRGGDGQGQPRAQVRFHPAVAVLAEDVSTADARLHPVWPHGLVRLRLVLPPALRSTLTVEVTRASS